MFQKFLFVFFMSFVSLSDIFPLSYVLSNRDWPTPKPTHHASSAPTCPATSSRTGWSTSCLLSPLVSACSPSVVLRAPTTSTPASLMDTGIRPFLFVWNCCCFVWRVSYTFIMCFCLQATTGLHSNPGPTGWDHRGLLENAVGTQLHYSCHVDQTERNGTGTSKTNMHGGSIFLCYNHKMDNY